MNSNDARQKPQSQKPSLAARLLEEANVDEPITMNYPIDPLSPGSIKRVVLAKARRSSHIESDKDSVASIESDDSSTNLEPVYFKNMQRFFRTKDSFSKAIGVTSDKAVVESKQVLHPPQSSDATSQASKADAETFVFFPQCVSSGVVLSAPEKRKADTILESSSKRARTATWSKS